MDSQVEEIKNRLNIVDVVGSYVKLTKTGVNYRGVCPFHSEKTPSFFVTPSKQMWHCFGCGAGSSMFDFVMKIEGVEFGDALRILAQKAGVELKKENVQLRTERQRLYEVCELATKFFEKQLEGSGMGQEAESYLLKRGLSKESIKKWRVGYSPDTWNGLSDFLIGRGYKREEVVKAGLAIEKPASPSQGGEGGRGDSYDRFRGRIIFPVFDLNSQPVGFGGRVFKQADKKETAKYINTPQTLLYDKSNIMYGMNFAKVGVRKADRCVVTEGYTDVIMCHQAGFENTVASSGTALTAGHLNLLKRYSPNLILAFDMDVAGDSATKRGINLAQEQGFNIKIIGKYSDAKDPADVILENPENWTKRMESARSIMDYYFDSAFSAFNKDIPEGKKGIGNILLPVVKRISNKIEQSFWVQKLSEKLNIKEDAITEELARTKITESYSEPAQAQQQQKPVVEDQTKPRKTLLEEKIVSLILKDPISVNLISEEKYGLFSEKIRKFLENVKKIMDSKSVLVGSEAEKDFKVVLADMSEPDSDFKNLIAALTLRAESEYPDDGQEEFMLCIKELEKIESRSRQNQMLKSIEDEKDESKKQELIKEFDKEAKKFHSI